MNILLKRILLMKKKKVQRMEKGKEDFRERERERGLLQITGYMPNARDHQEKISDITRV